jgi:hypothetical protein
MALSMPPSMGPGQYSAPAANVRSHDVQRSPWTRGTIVAMVRTLQIPYDDSVLLETSLPPEDFEREAKLLLAAKLFEMGRMSSGKAAELCGMSRVGVSMNNLRPEDALDEVAFVQRS